MLHFQMNHKTALLYQLLYIKPHSKHKINQLNIFTANKKQRMRNKMCKLKWKSGIAYRINMRDTELYLKHT